MDLTDNYLQSCKYLCSICLYSIYLCWQFSIITVLEDETPQARNIFTGNSSSEHKEYHIITLYPATIKLSQNNSGIRFYQKSALIILR